ncbi:MAG: glucose 1-dehydrogenase [Acidobacteria bacterium]|nr:glucose 1-dehydrogenase [Acidobacteriota bacterium]MCI0626354.1 glucose 1-dehydrogenase [Acidobacteriota bacterium]MCI0719131.1 glucose 1-dehydrogenase [Acidobacteriota bacterium]
MPITSILQRLFSLEGKTALVTGASGGLGRVMAVALATAGARVGIHGVKAEKLEETRQAVEQAGGFGVILAASLHEAAHCRKLAEDAQVALGRVDILVNCAGANRRKLIEAVTPEDFDTIIAVNLRSAFFLSQALHPMMRNQGGGKIINIGSMTSTLGFANLSVYGMTKSALAQLTKTMAVEWARDNIQVNCVAPGFMHTPLTEEYYWKDAHRSRWMLDRIPARRAGIPEDLAGIVIWLASPASSYVTGQVIAVDGGFTAGGSWEKDFGVCQPPTL